MKVSPRIARIERRALLVDDRSGRSVCRAPDLLEMISMNSIFRFILSTHPGSQY
jgi:hypothetical protein